ncbi:MAG: YtxH domain-containing protein [Bacillota bacterium]
MREDSCSFVVGIFVGALLGAATGILVAPRKGEETREQLLQRTKEMHQELQTEADNLREEFSGELKRRAGEALNWSTEMIRKMEQKVKEVEQKLSDMQRKLDEAESETN